MNKKLKLMLSITNTKLSGDIAIQDDIIDILTILRELDETNEALQERVEVLENRAKPKNTRSPYQARGLKSEVLRA